jgi:hypothetical protein
MIDFRGYLGGDQRLYRRIDDHRHYTLMGCICMYDECSPEYPNSAVLSAVNRECAGAADARAGVEAGAWVKNPMSPGLRK